MFYDRRASAHQMFSGAAFEQHKYTVASSLENKEFKFASKKQN